MGRQHTILSLAPPLDPPLNRLEPPLRCLPTLLWKILDLPLIVAWIFLSTLDHTPVRKTCHGNCSRKRMLVVTEPSNILTQRNQLFVTLYSFLSNLFLFGGGAGLGGSVFDFFLLQYIVNKSCFYALQLRRSAL